MNIKWIKNNPERFDTSMEMRGLDIRTGDVIAAHRQHFDVEEQRRILVTDQKVLVKKIANDPSNQDYLDQSLALKKQIKDIDLDESLQQFQQFLLAVPNILDDRVHPGKGDTDNYVMHYYGDKPVVDDALTHDKILPSLLDTQTAAAISGARFAVLRGPLAKLERALGQFMIDLHTKHHGFEEIAVPYIVRPEALVGTGQLPKFKEDLYAVGDKYLIPTAEVPLTAMYMDRLDQNPDPLRMVALTPCFRSEAGSSGKDIRGLIRQHQFNKVELVSVTTEDQAINEHEYVTQCAETVLRKLGLHYRVVRLCAGDTGFSSSITYDLEVWLPGQNEYREISSVSLCGAFQAERLNARYRDGGQNQFYHTVNGSGVAVGRALVAILENYQFRDGISVPPVLRDYMEMDIIPNG